MIGRQSLTPHSPFFMKTTIFYCQILSPTPTPSWILNCFFKGPKATKILRFFKNISLGVSSKDKDMKKGC